MCTFLERRGYSPTLLERDLQRVSRVSRRNAIQDTNVVTNGTERIPLVLTYHPFNSHIKKILLANFNILMNDETTREIFPLPPLTSYRRDQNIRDILVHTSMKSQSGSPAGTYPCGVPRCRTCAPCISHHHHRWTTTQHHHKGAFYLQIQQRCLLHFTSSLPGLIHWGNRPHAQGTHW